jgi:hypothetical protein
VSPAQRAAPAAARRAVVPRALAAVLAVALPVALPLAARAPAAAQDGDDGADAPPAPTQPKYTGRDRASGQASGALGASYELGNGARLVIPAGNRISSSQTFTFSQARETPRPQEIAEGFVRQGPVLRFDGQIDATAAPVQVSIRQRTLTARPGMRLVLAMEVAGLCDAAHPQRIAGPLCSHWRLLDARHVASEGRISASLPAPGGYRLVFGWVPAT